MVRIAVCDDDNHFLSSIESMVRGIVPNSNLELFHSGIELLSKFDGLSLDAVLLDIKMPLFSGLETARDIRRINEHLPIIIMTDYLDYVRDGYKIAALDYLVKPIQKMELQDAIKRALRISHSLRGETILLEEKGIQTVLALRDIIYLESCHKFVLFHTIEQAHMLRASLQKWEQLLSEKGFYRINKSFLLNLSYHYQRTGEDIILTEGTRLKLSRKQRNGYATALQKRWEKTLGWEGGL